MDQYNLDEDKVFEILKKCSPNTAPSEEQTQIMDYENLDASGDYSPQIHSIRNYFSPNFVLALRSMEPAEAEELFFREDPSVLSKIELFFNQILPTIPLVSKDEINNELSAFSDFIRDNHDKFILWGETDSIFKSCFWLQAGLTNCSLQFLKEPEDNKAYYRERAKKKIDPPNLKAPTRSISLPKELDSSFVSSLRINSSNRKKYHPFIGDKWFQDEEKELRETIVSFYKKTLQIISDFIANPDFSPSEKYLRLAERTFSVPELELLLGKSIRFFSWPLRLNETTEFEYQNNFLANGLCFLSHFELECESGALTETAGLFSKIASQGTRCQPICLNSYEAIRMFGGYKRTVEVTKSYQALEPRIRSAQSRANKNIKILKNLINSKRSLKNDSEGFIEVKASIVPKLKSPDVHGFSSDYSLFYPKGKTTSPLKLYPNQIRVVQLLLDKEATNAQRAVSKEQIFRDIYELTAPEMIQKVKAGDEKATKQYEIKLKAFRLDNYVFDRGDAWKVGFIKSQRKVDQPGLFYWLDLEYYKNQKPKSTTRTTRKKTSKK